MRKAQAVSGNTGTANAIYQNMNYMEMYNPDYVLILSGDHIYKMDYEVMLDFHKENHADVTIATMPVLWRRQVGLVLSLQMKRTGSRSLKRSRHSREVTWLPWVSTYLAGRY
mgnify:CR=1 FL=1